VGYHYTEFSRNRFGLFERDYNIINMLANGCERFGHGGAVEFLDHVEKQHEFRAYTLSGAQCAMRRAYV